MKILHTADIHLREDRDERLSALGTILETGNRESVDLMVISGDLFDADIDAVKLKSVLRELFSAVKYDIIIIPGNHDSRSYEDRAFFGSKVKVIRSYDEKIETDDAVITGLPFRDGRDDIYPMLTNISAGLSADKCNILLYHGELLDSYYSRKDFGEEGDSRYMPVRLDFFAGLNFDYILAGHFHTNFNVWEFENQKGPGYFIFSGSPVSITKRETGKRKVNLFNTGEAPLEVTVDTFFYDAVNVRLDPDTEPLSAINKKLLNADPKSKILLTIDGYLNSSKHGIDETALHEKLEAIKSENKNIIELNYNAVNIGKILEDNIFKSFELKLKSAKYSALEKEAVRGYFLKAMMESLS